MLILGRVTTASSRPLFFFQAEDGIRDIGVTGVQTCALPIWGGRGGGRAGQHEHCQWPGQNGREQGTQTETEHGTGHSGTSRGDGGRPLAEAADSRLPTSRPVVTSTV